MKTTIVCSLALLFICCHTQNEQDPPVSHSTAVTAIGDVTDPKQLWIRSVSILPLYNFTQYPNAEAWFNLTAISDKQINPSFRYHLPTAQEAEQYNAYGDEQYRTKTIIQYYSQIRQAIDTFYRIFDTTASLNNSECFSVIATELTRLQHLPAERKFLLVYSDLMERSVVDAYSNSTPQEISNRLLQYFPIPDSLTGIKVWIIYQPGTRSEDQQVNRMIQVYQQIIEARGGTLEVKTNTTSLKDE
jgi:hypothetical protein